MRWMAVTGLFFWPGVYLLYILDITFYGAIILLPCSVIVSYCLVIHPERVKMIRTYLH